MLASVKKIALFAAGVASQRYIAGLEEQQEIMADLADMISQIYALESALLRAQKLAAAGRGSATVAAAMTGLLRRGIDGPCRKRRASYLAACAEGDALRTQLAILRRLARYTPADATALSRSVARCCIDQESIRCKAGFVGEPGGSRDHNARLHERGARPPGLPIRLLPG